ncbi:hypothetical protein BH11PLA2_BH11PLA2_02380 [soil metagenome]
MTANIEIPDALAAELRERSLAAGVSYTEALNHYLRIGLAAPSIAPIFSKPRIERSTKTGFPIIVGGHPAALGDELTPEVAADILLKQEAEWFLDIR